MREVVRHGVAWIAERVERLRQLWLERRLSASQIANEFGVSRGAILGKIWRLGLKGTRKPSRHPVAGFKRPQRDPQWKPKPRPQPLAVDDDDELTMQEFLAVELFDLKPGQCRYPHGEASPFAFCGQPVREGSSYCAHHHALVHVPVSNRRSDPYAFWGPAAR